MDTHALEQLRALRRDLPPATIENAAMREDMLVEARSLLLALEEPDNVVERVAFQVIETVIISTAVKMGVIKILNESETCSMKEVAEACGADPVLVGRVLRGLAAFGDVDVKESDVFGPSTVTRTFGQRKGLVGLDACEFMRPGWLAIPEYLERKGWSNPTSSTDTSLAQGYNKPEGATAFEIAFTSPLLDGLVAYMATHNEHHRPWYDFYPVMERWRPWTPSNWLEGQLPSTPRSLHRFVLCDWSDKYTRRILQNLVPAMSAGTRVILNEICLHEFGAVPLYQEQAIRGYDMSMKHCFNGRQRDRDDWVRLIRDADERFSVIRIETPPGSMLSIIEIKWKEA